jgi:fumarate hydratase, class I
MNSSVLPSLRPGHLQQLANILDDPEATRTTASSPRPAEERQHRRRRRAADVPGHRHGDRHGQEGPARLDEGDDEEAIARGVARRLHREEPALFAARAALDVRGEEHRQQPAGPDRDLRATEDAYKFLFMAKGGGSANKTFLYQETPSLLNPTDARRSSRRRS